MPSWGEILEELTLQAQQQGGGVDFDSVRRKYLTALQAHTGRSTILYATDFLSGTGPSAASISLVDMQGFMEVFRDLPGPNLDLILHSPGGEAEATDRLVRYMRSKFDHVRVFVPLAAMSAATMWCMAADEIVMGKHSQLGPIDPQITFRGTTVPAGALIDQFREASEQCSADPSKITGWLPTLQQYPPGLLNVCESAGALARKLVEEWANDYLLKGRRNRREKASKLADWLADDKAHLSHSRAITRDQLRKYDVPVRDLEDDQALQDALLSVHHTVMHTFAGTAAFKIIENHLGRAFVLQGGQVVVGPQPQPPAPPPSPGPPRGP